MRKDSALKLARNLKKYLIELGSSGEKDDAGFMDNVQIYAGGMKLTEKGEEVAAKKATDITEYANNDTVTIIYDGGMLYSVMNGEYGWSTHNKIIEWIEKNAPKGMYLENCTSWASTLVE